MNNQEEQFWAEFPEDELRDPANRQVLAALRNAYRIDKEDRRSVQRVWKRIEESADQQKQHISRLDTYHGSPEFFIDAKNHIPVQRNRTKQRLNILAALIIIFLLVGSMIGVLAHRGSSVVGARPTAVPTQNVNTPSPSNLLGTHIGVYSLGMTVGNLEGDQNFTFEQDGTVLCKCGLQIFFKSPLSSQSTSVQLVAWNYAGQTDEGFRIGGSLSYFMQLYQRFNVKQSDIQAIQQISTIPIMYPFSSVGDIVSATDTNGTTFWAVFNNQKLAIEIVLQSKCKTFKCS